MGCKYDKPEGCEAYPHRINCIGKVCESYVPEDKYQAYIDELYTAAERCMGHKPLTNFERIKAMTVDEMAKWLREVAHNYVCNDYCRKRKLCDGECVKACIDWLESEVQEDDR